MTRSFKLHPSKTRRRIVAGAMVAALSATLAGAALVTAAENGPDWLTVDSWSAGAASATTVRLYVTTDAAILRQADQFIADNLITGFAWADLDTGTALVATIHPNPLVGRDSKQRPDAWHVHTVQLGGGATGLDDFCLVGVLSSPTAGLRIQGSTMSIDIAASRLPDAGSGPISFEDFDTAVGFTVHQDGGCTDTGLGVRLRY
jgi:hypothetical protein